jgi:hypothetical protein
MLGSMISASKLNGMLSTSSGVLSSFAMASVPSSVVRLVKESKSMCMFFMLFKKI